MANVTIGDDTKYVELKELCYGNYFLLNGDLYIIIDDSFCGCAICFNLSDDEEREEIDDNTMVLPVPSDKVKIKVEI